MTTGDRLLPLWTWPNVLALDAPLVALVWQSAFAEAFGAALAAGEVTVLGLSVWLVYAADRWLDGLRLRSDAPTTPRHAFFALRRGPLLGAWLGVLVVDLAVAVTTLDPLDLARGAVLLGVAVGYLLAVHIGSGTALPKEILVAAIFAAGATVFLGGVFVPALPVLLFAGLCFLNCAFIGCWEDAIDRGQGGPGLAQRLPALAGRLPEAALLLAAVALVAAGPTTGLAAAVALAALGLLALHLVRSGLETNLRRVLADAVLLTPLLLA